MKKRILNLFAVAAVALSAVSCEQFLTVEPIDKMSADTYFKNELELELFANGMINSYLPTADGLGYSDSWSDLFCSKTSSDFYRPGIWNADKQGSWGVSNWRNIRRANIMLEGMARSKGNVSEETYNHYQGVARLWRAYFYFAKVQTFGNVPWIDHALDVEDEILYAPCDDREYVMSKVLEDLNFACQNLSGDTKYNGVVNKWVALAFKARVCLYEGTFRKYHSVNPSTNVAWNNNYEKSADLLQECVNAADELMKSGNFSLHTDYSGLFHHTNIASSPEAIWWSDYDSGELNRMHELTWVVNSSTYDQQVSPTKLMMNHYLNLDGTPITNEGKVTIEQEFEGRDLRLKACVHHPGYMYTKVNGETLLKNTNTTYTYNFYQNVKFSIENEENYSKGKNDNDYPILRYGEVLLNYAEAKAELNNGELSLEDWNKTIGLLRARAGVANIYPDASWDCGWIKAYYGNLSNVLTEIRRERTVELLGEGMREADLYRWKLGHLIVDRQTNNQGWMGVWVPKELVGGMPFNGATYTFTNTKPEAGLGYNVSGSTADQNHSFSEGDHGFLIYNYKLEWKDRNYVRPIPQTVLNVNKNIQQNYGW
ncbi:MAG: RagB/SusD family nutrient uptake outer membrane protein [Alistipes sp.]|nr:RagB/SusD family nutrient uptake outer membrane protein [Alistipes sp.]